MSPPAPTSSTRLPLFPSNNPIPLLYVIAITRRPRLEHRSREMLSSIGHDSVSDNEAAFVRDEQHRCATDILHRVSEAGHWLGGDQTVDPVVMPLVAPGMEGRDIGCARPAGN
jgi:hypothetical protein